MREPPRLKTSGEGSGTGQSSTEFGALTATCHWLSAPGGIDIQRGRIVAAARCLKRRSMRLRCLQIGASSGTGAFRVRLGGITDPGSMAWPRRSRRPPTKAWTWPSSIRATGQHAAKAARRPWHSAGGRQAPRGRARLRSPPTPPGGRTLLCPAHPLSPHGQGLPALRRHPPRPHPVAFVWHHARERR